jgi:hypothetical protein
MSSDAPNPPAPDSESAPVAMPSQDLVLNLDFVPTWARKPAENPYAHREERPPGDRGPERARGRREGQGRRDKSRRERPRERAPRGPERAPSPRLPVRISFLPERHQLSALVRQLTASEKAYPLSYLAHLLLAKPEYHAIKIEAHGDITLYRFKPDGAVFLDLESLRAHAIRRQLNELFDESVEQTEAPAGQFACVGRCSLSGEWLGPPNYHGYQERLLDLHRTRFPHMKIDEYRAHIELVRDPAAIQQWKEHARTRRVYRPKGQPEAEPLSREEAVQHLLQRHLPDWQEAGRRFIMPASLVRELPDGPLRRQIEQTWQREHRNPFTMNLALRPAFRHMKMHIFKAGRGEPFVTAIAPKPLDATHAVATIRAMLDLLREHPGWDRARLVEHLRPGLDPASDEARELLAPLRWLIEKGHVIEFFDGTLSVPTAKPPPAAPAG